MFAVLTCSITVAQLPDNYAKIIWAHTHTPRGPLGQSMSTFVQVICTVAGVLPCLSARCCLQLPQVDTSLVSTRQQ